MKAKAVLFDLDGTLLDTAPDLVFALNKLREEHGLSPFDLAAAKHLVGQGSKPMLKAALDIEAHDPLFIVKRQAFLDIYAKHLADSTTFFPYMEEVLNYLESHSIPWGIVTNKLTVHTLPLLQALQIMHRPGCIVCGDTLSKYKPDPEPILHACELLKQHPEDCIFVGDTLTDMVAGKAAGVRSLVALYGYIGEDDNPQDWPADGYLKEARDLITWLNNDKC